MIIIILSIILALSLGVNVFLYIRNRIYKHIKFDMRMLEEVRDMMNRYFSKISDEEFEQEFQKVIKNARVGSNKN